MKRIRPIVTSILLIYVRIWSINTIFSQQKNKIKITLQILGIASCIVGALYLYTYSIGNIQNGILDITKHISNKSIAIFIGYCAAWIALMTIFFKNRYKKIIEIILMGGICFIAIAYGGLITGINVMIVYYLISAYAEEYMKYSAGSNVLLANKDPNENNLIFICILVGLGFSIVENILYSVNTIIQQQNIDIMNLIIGRGLISTLIHIVSTSTIAFISIKTKKTKIMLIPIVLGILGGFGIHSLYNISLQYNLLYITIPMIIIAFFLMSYLLFQSDMLYKKQ